MNSEPIQVTLEVITALEQLNIPYVIGGSLASSQHGTARATMDSDLVIQLRERQIPALIARLKRTFYADEAMARHAVQTKGSFNVIHLEKIFKVDLFVAGDRPFDQAQLTRRIPQKAGADTDREIYFLTAEDTILAKLAWYRAGGEQSERQWRDIEGIIRVQGEQLDIVYMKEMAQTLRVADLLDQLIV